MPTLDPRELEELRDYGWSGKRMCRADGALAKHDIVVISGHYGSQSAYPKVKKADSDTAVLSTDLLGITLHAAADGDEVVIVPWGFIPNVNTNGATIGDPVYLSGTAGGWTLTAPDIRRVRVGTVARVHATEGAILLEPGKFGGNRTNTNIASEVRAAADGKMNPEFVITKSYTAGASNTDFVTEDHGRSIRIIDVHIVSDGATGGSVTLQTAAGAANITNAMTPGNADVITRASSLLQANDEVAAGATLRIAAAAGAPAGTMFIRAVAL